MQDGYSRIWPYLIAILAVLLIYRRLRRSFGQQPVNPIRMRIRMGILILLGVYFSSAAFQSPQFLGAELAGLLAGIALAFWGASRTQYRSEGAQLYYVPHTYTGIAVSLLFMGRLAYRLTQGYLRNGPPMPGANPPTASLTTIQSPVTVGLAFVLIGYYVLYYGVVLRKTSRISPEELGVVPTSTTTSP
jgi:hypothetical protein